MSEILTEAEAGGFEGPSLASWAGEGDKEGMGDGDHRVSHLPRVSGSPLPSVGGETAEDHLSDRQVKSLE